jgi:RimJ/RimL family protein N-acetyltransferase
MALHTFSVDAALAALPGFPELRGRRTRLRGPREGDTDALFALFSDPRVMRYWSRPPMTTRAEASGLVAECLDNFRARTHVGWVITARDDDAAIGTCTLFHFDARNRRAEIGYALHPDHWGRGLARDAVARAIDWAVAHLRLHRIEADIDPRNDASRRLLHALGFRTEGHLRERWIVGGEVTDSEVLGLLVEERRDA